MLKQRIITAAILIPIVLWAILWANTVWFALLFAIFVAIGAWEWAKICKMSDILCYVYCVIMLFVMFGLYGLNDDVSNLTIIVCGVLYWCYASVMVVAYQRKRNLLPKSRAILLLMGFVILIPMWISLIQIKVSTNAATFLIFLMLLIWSADTGAYFIGKRWGKRKLASRVSPGKTWEGSVAGVVTAIVITIAYVIVSKKEISIATLIFVGLSAVTIIISIMGDLLESMVKREAKIKDSGTILPGHGGVLDRIDSLTAASPVFASGLIFLGLLE